MSEDLLTTEAGRQIVAAGKHLYAGGYAEGAREEREAVVRYLDAIGFKDLAGDIEAGEHRKP